MQHQTTPHKHHYKTGVVGSSITHVFIQANPCLKYMQSSIHRSWRLHLWKTYKTSSFMHLSRQMLLAHVALPGLSLEKQGRVYTPPLDVLDALSSHWASALPDVIDHVMVFGFVVIVLRLDTAKRLYPYVLPPETYEIKVVDGLEPSYEIYSHLELPKDVLVYDHFGAKPASDGRNITLTSTYMKCFEKLEFLRQLRGSCIKMELQKSTPQYFAEMHETTQDRQEGVDFDYYVADDASETREHAQFTRNQSNIKILQQHQQMYDAMLSDVRNEGVGPNNLKDIVQLPSGHRIVHTAQNTARQDIVQLHKIIQEELCTTIGVPRALLVADSQFKSSTEGVEAVFQNTIDWWRERLSILFTDLYTKVYVLPNNVNTSNKRMYRDKLKNEIKVIINVKVKHVPVDMEMLQKLYEVGVITWDAYIDGCASVTGLQRSSMNSAPPSQPLKRKRDSDNVNSSDVVTVTN
jgi:hypothetical protein